MSKKSDITETFRAAGRLINEWQDTLLYSSFVAGEILASAHNASNWCTVGVCMATVGREVTRAVFWAKNSHHTYAGYDSPKINNKSNETAAWFVASGAAFGFVIALALAPPRSSNTALAIGLGITTVSLRRAHRAFKAHNSKLTDIWSLYGIFDAKTGMWDWARKRGDGGGDTQTKKLIDGIGDLAKKAGAAIGGALPQPGPRPVYGFARQADVNLEV